MHVKANQMLIRCQITKYLDLGERFCYWPIKIEKKIFQFTSVSFFVYSTPTNQ